MWSLTFAALGMTKIGGSHTGSHIKNSAAPPHHGSKEMGLSSLDMGDDDDDDDDDEEGRNPRQVYACKPGDPYPGGQLPRISLGRCCGAFTARSDGDRLRHF